MGVLVASQVVRLSLATLATGEVCGNSVRDNKKNWQRKRNRILIKITCYDENHKGNKVKFRIEQKGV